MANKYTPKSKKPKSRTVKGRTYTKVKSKTSPRKNKLGGMAIKAAVSLKKSANKAKSK